VIGQAAKRFVLLSIAAALVLEIHMTAQGWPPFAWVCGIAFGTALVLGTIRAGLVSWIILGTAYAVPALFQVAAGRFGASFESAWLCALLGLMLPGLWGSGWNAPARWRLPLATWSLVVAGTWPILVLREIDATPALLQDRTLLTSKFEGHVAMAVMAILSAATTVGVILLAFDWLLGRYRRDDRWRFEREVLWPLAASWIVSALASVYQSFHDIAFVGPTVFAARGRAGALLLDANAYGIIAALWGPAGVVLGRSIPSPPLRVSAGLAAMALSWFGVWVSGSRTALVAAVVGTFFVVFHDDARPREPVVAPTAWPGRSLFGAAVLAAIMIAPIALLPRTTIIGPVARMTSEIAGKSPAAIAKYLWARDGYGRVADRMIAEHPLVGVGIGSYPILLPDYGYFLQLPSRLKSDNAQNWFRQQLAELGLVGSLPAIAWVWMVAILLTSTHGRGSDGPPAGVVKGAIVALGLVSLVGLPTQVPAVLLTGFVLVCWYLMFVEQAALAGLQRETRRSGAGAWGLALALVVCSIGGTAYAAATGLRPPRRALRADWPYMYGMHDLERVGNEPAFRWTGQRAVAVVRVDADYVKLRFRVAHPDLVTHPVDAKIWRTDASGQRLLIAVTLTDAAPVTVYVRAPEDRGRMMVETWVSRTWTPRDHGQADTRRLGLAVDDWTFVRTPPPGAMTVPGDAP
jgi:hypothetical protein